MVFFTLKNEKRTTFLSTLSKLNNNLNRGQSTIISVFRHKFDHMVYQDPYIICSSKNTVYSYKIDNTVKFMFSEDNLGELIKNVSSSKAKKIKPLQIFKYEFGVDDLVNDQMKLNSKRGLNSSSDSISSVLSNASSAASNANKSKVSALACNSKDFITIGLDNGDLYFLNSFNNKLKKLDLPSSVFRDGFKITDLSFPIAKNHMSKCVVGYSSGKIILVDVHNGKLMLEYQMVTDHLQSIKNICFSISNADLMVVLTDHYLLLYDIHKKEVLQKTYVKKWFCHDDFEQANLVCSQFLNNSVIILLSSNGFLLTVDLKNLPEISYPTSKLNLTINLLSNEVPKGVYIFDSAKAGKYFDQLQVRKLSNRQSTDIDADKTVMQQDVSSLELVNVNSPNFKADMTEFMTEDISTISPVAETTQKFVFGTDGKKTIMNSTPAVNKEGNSKNMLKTALIRRQIESNTEPSQSTPMPIEKSETIPAHLENIRSNYKIIQQNGDQTTTNSKLSFSDSPISSQNKDRQSLKKSLLSKASKNKKVLLDLDTVEPETKHKISMKMDRISEENESVKESIKMLSDRMDNLENQQGLTQNSLTKITEIMKNVLNKQDRIQEQIQGISQNLQNTANKGQNSNSDNQNEPESVTSLLTQLQQKTQEISLRNDSNNALIYDTSKRDYFIFKQLFSEMNNLREEVHHMRKQMHIPERDRMIMYRNYDKQISNDRFNSMFPVEHDRKNNKNTTQNHNNFLSSTINNGFSNVQNISFSSIRSPREASSATILEDENNKENKVSANNYNQKNRKFLFGQKAQQKF